MNKVPAMHLFISLSRWDSQTQEPLGSEREKVGQLGETRSGSAQSFFFVTFAACGPLGPVTISNSTKRSEERRVGEERRCKSMSGLMKKKSGNVEKQASLT